MDNKEFWKLLEPVHAEATRFAHKLVGDHARADDLYQDAVLRALQRLDSLKNRDAFRPWFYKILINRYRNSQRSWWNRGRTDLVDEVTAPGSDPRGRAEARRRLDQVMTDLPPRDRALVILHGVEGWSTCELAAMVKRPEGTVRTWLSRARRKMRKRLLQSDSEHQTRKRDSLCAVPK